MGIIITGLDMPTERESYNLTIKYNGMVLDTETGIQVSEAHELPPHGRLIDETNILKVFSEEVWGFHTDFAKGMQSVLTEIRAAPTIIEAEEGE